MQDRTWKRSKHSNKYDQLPKLREFPGNIKLTKKRIKHEIQSRWIWYIQITRGGILWAGNEKLPQTSLVVSQMQQTAPKLNVYDIFEAKGRLKELKHLNLFVSFNKMVTEMYKAEVWTSSDAYFNINSGCDYGQTGIISELHIKGDSEDKKFHIIDWTRENTNG